MISFTLGNVRISVPKYPKRKRHRAAHRMKGFIACFYNNERIHFNHFDAKAEFVIKTRIFFGFVTTNDGRHSDIHNLPFRCSDNFKCIFTSEQRTHNLEIRNVRQQRNSCANVKFLCVFFRAPCRFHFHLHSIFFLIYAIYKTHVFAALIRPADAKQGFITNGTKELIKVTLVGH